jgi:hypothetical protein
MWVASWCQVCPRESRSADRCGRKASSSARRWTAWSCFGAAASAWRWVWAAPSSDRERRRAYPSASWTAAFLSAGPSWLAGALCSTVLWWSEACAWARRWPAPYAPEVPTSGVATGQISAWPEESAAAAPASQPAAGEAAAVSVAFATAAAEVEQPAWAAAEAQRQGAAEVLRALAVQPRGAGAGAVRRGVQAWLQAAAPLREAASPCWDPRPFRRPRLARRRSSRSVPVTER